MTITKQYEKDLLEDLEECFSTEDPMLMLELMKKLQEILVDWAIEEGKYT